MLWDWLPWESVSEPLESLHERLLSLRVWIISCSCQGSPPSYPLPSPGFPAPSLGWTQGCTFPRGLYSLLDAQEPASSAASWMHLFSRSESPPVAHKHPRSPDGSLLAPPGLLSTAQSSRTMAAGYGSLLHETQPTAGSGAGLPIQAKTQSFRFSGLHLGFSVSLKMWHIPQLRRCPSWCSPVFLCTRVSYDKFPPCWGLAMSCV